MKNILEFIENSALKYPDKLAVADEEGGLTYGQMERLSRQIGAWIYEKTDGVRISLLPCCWTKSLGVWLPIWELSTVAISMWYWMRRCRRPEPSRYSER